VNQSLPAAIMAAYLQLARLRLLSSLVYRFEVVTGTATNLVLMTAAVFLWVTAYRGGPSVSPAGVSLPQMVTYAIASVLLGSLFVSTVQDVIPMKVRRGDLAVDLVRPVNPLGCWLAEDAGLLAGRTLTQLLPQAMLAALIFRPLAPASAAAAWLCLASCLLGFLITWMLGAISGLVAFWTVSIGNLGHLKDAVVRVLSGSIVPLWLFPRPLQTASSYLPFQYTFQTPLAIYIGKLSAREALPALLVQAVWVAALGGATKLLWSAGRRRLLIQGG
jgi:ABC-2 type transport system permease protein